MPVTKWWAQLVEGAASEAYVFDPATFRFRLVNRAARENLGYSAEELNDLTPWDLKPEISQFRFMEMVAPLVARAQNALNFETVHRRKDGSLYQVSVRLQLLRQENDAVYYAAIEDVTEQRESERALREATGRLNAILNNTRMAVFMMDDRQHCIFMNAAAEDLTGYTLPEVKGRPLHDVIHHSYPDGRPFPLSECAIDRAFPENNQTSGEEVFIHKDGTFYPVGFTASPMRDGERIVGTVIEVRNITHELRNRETIRAFNETLQQRVNEVTAEHRKIEAQLFQAQKMEALGKLTGGVAHDFNNVLQVVKGNLDLLRKDVAGQARAEQRVHNALTGLDRGAKLASQLLSFGRRQPLAPRSVNLGRIVRDLDDMLRRALGEEVEIETVISGGLWNCAADPVQLENAILNLAINARDAMQRRGKLTIEAGNASLTDAYVAEYADLAPGQYVMLAVTDTGCGMTPEVLAQALEPFFSTKSEGEGSGLGLSMVYGFAKQSGGHLKLYSEVDQGTTVRLYLPRTSEAEFPRKLSVASAVRGGREAILVVEDDEAVRNTTVDLLANLGYSVLQANNADNALAIIESGVAVDLLFTDVVMPGKLRSPELVSRAKARWPNLAVLYTSGYTQNAIVHSGRLDDGVELLSKPFGHDELGRKIRALLDSRATVEFVKPSAKAANKMLRILVVEDEVLIRLNTIEMLTDLGHVPHEAASIADAKTMLAQSDFDLIITDMRLPDGSGLEFTLELVQRPSSLRVILASGHSIDQSLVGQRLVYLPKPFDLAGLANAIMIAMDA